MVALQFQLRCKTGKPAQRRHLKEVASYLVDIGMLHLQDVAKVTANFRCLQRIFHRSVSVRVWVRMLKEEPEILGALDIRAVRDDVLDFLSGSVLVGALDQMVQVVANTMTIFSGSNSCLPHHERKQRQDDVCARWRPLVCFGTVRAYGLRHRLGS